jgi:hypothetical protein
MGVELFGPGEGLGLVVGVGDEAVDDGLKIDDRFEDRPGAVERLDLAFFVDAEDDGMGRRVDVQTDHIFQLFGKLRIVGELERAHPMRLQPVRLPDAAHRGRADPPALAIAGAVQWVASRGGSRLVSAMTRSIDTRNICAGAA